MNETDPSRPRLSSTGQSENGFPNWASSPLVISAVAFVTFFIIVVAIHASGFGSPMIYDSDGWIIGRDTVFRDGGLFPVIGIVPVRPLFMASLYLNYAVAGMDPWSFRVVNALILVMAGCALAWMILGLLEIPRLAIPGTFWEKRAVAFGLALIFVAHPLQSFVVLYIWQREAIMACFFYFSCFYLYLEMRSGRWKNPVIAYISLSVLFFLGLLCKENLCTLPVVLGAAEVVLFPENLRKTAQRLFLIVILAAPAFILYVMVTHYLRAPNTPDTWNVIDRLAGYYQTSGISLVQVILTECRVFFSYLMMMFLPFWHPMQLLQPQILSVTLWDPPTTALAVLGIVVLMGVAGWLVKRKPLVGFGILFTMITVAPESLLLPQYLFFAYRAILPMAGVLIAGAAVLLYILGWARDTSAQRIVKPVLAGVLVVAVVSLGLLTASQARHWTPLEFWRAAYAHMPADLSRVEPTAAKAIPINLGAVLINSGDYAEAAHVLREAARLDPDSPFVRVNLGIALCKSGASTQGIEILQKLVQDKPRFLPAWTALADALREENRANESVTWLRKAIRHNPENGMLRFRLAAALIDAGNFPEAVQILNRIAESNPTDPRVRVQMGRAMITAQNWPEAIKQFSLALQIDPVSLPAMQGLVLAQRRMREAEEAVAKLQAEVKSHPESADARYRLARALQKSGKLQEAIAGFQKAVELQPDMDRARAELGLALLSAGRNAEAVESLKQAAGAITGNAELHYALGLALKKEGRQSEAIQQFKEALAIDPAHSDARELLRSMQSPAAQPKPPKAH